MNEMRAVGLHKIREPAGAADAGDGGDFFVPELALFNQLEYSASTEKSPQPGHHVGWSATISLRVRPGARRWRVLGR